MSGETDRLLQNARLLPLGSAFQGKASGLNQKRQLCKGTPKKRLYFRHSCILYKGRVS